MITLSTLGLLISNAVCLRRDMSILYNRITIIALLYAILQSLVTYSIITKGGIGVHGGLFHVTNITQIFHIFLYLISILILQLTSFYPSKKIEDIESNDLYTKATPWQILSESALKLRVKFVNNLGEHLKIIEYPAKQSGKLLTLWGKFPNSGDLLKLLIPNLDDVFHGG